MTRRKAFSSLRVAFLGVLVVLALAVSGRQAFAASAALDCLDDGWNWLGACASTEECDAECEAIHGPEGFGICNGGCCRCLF